MVSTATTRLRLNKQGTGDSANTWGVVLNGQVFDLTDEAIAGVETIALTGDKTLTSTNYVSDEARNMGLRFTGSLVSGATITIPAVEKLYFIINDSGQTLTFSAGAGTVGVETGRRKWIACDGTDVYMAEDGADFEYVEATFLKLAGGTLTGQVTAVGDPTADGHLARKKYVDDNLMAVTSTAELPGQTGNSGKFLTTDGTVASWSAVDLSPYLTTAAAAAAYQPLDADLTSIAALSTSAAGREQLILNRRNVAFADSPVTAAYGDDISCDTSGGAITINLPAAVAGRAPIIIRAGADAVTNNITVEPDGAETILGESNLVIDINFFAYSFAAKAGAWV
jgi:hypothetical protein